MIRLEDITLRRGAKVILSQATLTLNPGEKIGLVGRNGAGKSTLFVLLSGALREDGGEFFCPAHWRIAQVAQDMPDTAQSAVRFVIEGDTTLRAAEEEVASAEISGDGERLSRAYMALHDAGSHDAAARAEALILGLGFTMDDRARPVNEFSGGWRMRLQLARALMRPSDVLLLDEPTNHLDLDALVWLETWLKRYEGLLLVISHDREFLDAVTRITLHIDNERLTRYGGNVSVFEETRAARLAEQQQAYLKQQDRIAHLQKFIDRFRAKASKARQAQSRVKALERMERLAPALVSAGFGFTFKETANPPNPMLVLKNVDCGYSADDGVAPARAVIVRGVSRVIAAGQRIGVLGANGQGKSTLVKTIARILDPLGGTLTPGKGLSIGYFAQHELDVLCPQESPLQHLQRLARARLPEGVSGREQDLRGFLGAFDFGGDLATQAVGTMSGGEKARLLLCMLVWQRPNLLLLDEPTNHLDLETREALCLALNEFTGTVLLVSHDRALLRAVCDEFWLVSSGSLIAFDGDIDDYQAHLRAEAQTARDARRRLRDKPIGRSVAPNAAARVKALKRELEKSESRLEALHANQQALQARLSSTLTREAFNETCTELARVEAALSECEENWLALSEQIEAPLAS